MGRSRAAFIGIDVACAKGKRLPVVVCTEIAGRLIPLALRRPELRQPPVGQGNAAALVSSKVRAFADEVAHYLTTICDRFDLDPKCIAIDAPSGPRREGENARMAEKALCEKGISCFSTPSEREFEQIKTQAGYHLSSGLSLSTLPHANKLWMLVGFALFERLSRIAPCIEVFPNAIAHALRCYVHKSKPGGVAAQLRAAAKHTGWPDSAHEAVAFADIAWCPSHDRLDAYLSAWVASLPENARKAYGDGGKDAIWVPNLENPAAFPDAVHPVYDVVAPNVKQALSDAGLPGAPSPVHDPSLSRSCPACSSKLFKRWPWGWDGHAAVCSGLADGDLEVRKAEFKRRFLPAAV